MTDAVTAQLEPKPFEVARNGNKMNKVPWGDVALSLFGFGPIPTSKVVKTVTMVGESNRLTEPDGTLTPAEEVTRSRPISKAQKYLEKVCDGEAKKLIHGIKALFSRINVVEDTIAQVIVDPVVGPNGEKLSTDEAHDHHDTLRDQVTFETQSGSKKHLIRRRRTKAMEVLSIVLDFPVFLIAMFALFNVDVRRMFLDFGSIVMAVTALVFALMATLMYAFLMRFFGRRHRQFKNAEGGVDRAKDSRFSLVMFERGFAVAIAVAAATLMAVRLWEEGASAGAPVVMTVVIAFFFAAVLGFSGYMNYMSEFEDGSDTTDRIQHLAAVLIGRDATLSALEREKSVLIEEAGLRIAALNRLISHAQEHAQKMIVGSKSDKAIHMSRSYSRNELPLPEVDLTNKTVEMTLQQATELTEFHKNLKNTHLKEI